jgi:hypothetical protein
VPVDAAVPRAEDGRTSLVDGRQHPRSQMGGTLSLGWVAAGRQARGGIGRGGSAVACGWEVASSLAGGRRCPRSRMGGTLALGMNHWWDPHVNHV